jgi:carboxyl-terminal processing protease
MLLPAGKPIVETRGRDHEVRRRYASTVDGPYVHLPLAVIVNQDSASAAEIMAACLQDHKRAAVVGQRSYGKGPVQQLVPLESGRSLLKLTWASFWRPSGAKIHRSMNGAEDETWGVVPDAGFERVLSAEEYAAYRKYRAERDSIPATQQDRGPEINEQTPTANFVDEQLRLAVEHLQDKLDEASSQND